MVSMVINNITISFSDELRIFWQEWNIRIFVLLSQFLQIMLYFLMPYRKRTSNRFILFLTNATYEGSFKVASWALVFLSAGFPGPDRYQPPLVLWASFILLHIARGGHTTARTLDDYDTWYSRSFDFLSGDLIIFIVICLQWHKVDLPGGWALILVVAIVEFQYRTQFLATGRPRKRFRDITKKRYKGIVLKNKEEGLSFDEFDLMNNAFACYQSTKKLIQGLRFTRTEREDHQKAFLQLDAKDAVRIVEIELNLTYDSYFTNGFDPPQNEVYRGCFAIFRTCYITFLLALFAIVATRQLPSISRHPDPEHIYSIRDNIITRILCFSNVLLEFLSWLKFLSSQYVTVFWGIRTLARLPHRRRWWSSDNDRDATAGGNKNILIVSYLMSLARLFFRRWSETISRRSFMVECFREATMKSSSLPRIFLKWYVTPPTSGSQWYNDDVGKFIFNKMLTKANISKEEDVAWNIFDSMGDQILLGQPLLTPHTEQLQDLFLKKPSEVRLLLWHIVTEILYYADNHQQGDGPPINRCREMAILLSEYMLYLALQPTNIMPSWGYYMYNYRRISRYIKDNNESKNWYHWSRTPLPVQLQTFYDKMRGKYRDGHHIDQHLLVDAIKIAEVIRNSLDEPVLWEVVSEVWVEMLVYTATHSNPMDHVEGLAEGGGLITIVWLLSAHLGFGNYFLDENEEVGGRREGDGEGGR